jgi:hypothetical protein
MKQEASAETDCVPKKNRNQKTVIPRTTTLPHRIRLCLGKVSTNKKKVLSERDQNSKNRESRPCSILETEFLPQEVALSQTPTRNKRFLIRETWQGLRIGKKEKISYKYPPYRMLRQYLRDECSFLSEANPRTSKFPTLKNIVSFGK